jgi:hypothetical protein
MAMVLGLTLVGGLIVTMQTLRSALGFPKNPTMDGTKIVTVSTSTTWTVTDSRVGSAGRIVATRIQLFFPPLSERVVRWSLAGATNCAPTPGITTVMDS